MKTGFITLDGLLPFQQITDFGDSAVLIAAVVSAAAMLIALGHPRTAVRFFVTFLLAAAAIGGLKIALIGCGNGVSRAIHLHSPSGHVALSTAFWGALAAYISRGRSGPQTRALVWLGSLAMILSIAISRLALGYHTKSEVLVGLAVGIVAILLAGYCTPAPEAQSRANMRTTLMVLSVVMLAMILSHGYHLPAEQIARRLAAFLPEYVPWCRG